MNPKAHTFLLALIFLLVFISSPFVFARESDPDKTKTPCADAKDKAKAESIEAYQFGVKVQQAIEKEDVNSLFELINGELSYGPRKKDVSGKSFDAIFTAGWKEAILAQKPSCYPNGSRGFVLGGDLVWYDKIAEGIWSIHSIIGAHIAGLSESNEPSWKYGNDLLRPNCFTKKWASGDNYEFYHEHYGGNSAYPDFVRNIGRYMGAKIPLEAVTADWGDKLSLAVELTKCSTPYSSLGKPIKQGNSNSTITTKITDEAVIETCSSDTYECSIESDSYTALRNIPLEACGLLSPHFKDDCVGVRLVRIEPACTGCNSNANIYGIIKDRASKRIYVVPLANLGSYKNALNYVDKLVTDLSAMDSEIPSNLTQKKAEQKHPKVTRDKNRAYKVSLRIFDTEKLAKQFRSGLLKKGLTPNIEQIENKWEVSIGPYPSEKSARQALFSIKVVTNLKTSAEQGSVDTQFDKEAVKRLKLSAEQGNVDARDKLSLLLAGSREARDYFEGMRVKKGAAENIEIHGTDDSIKIHSNHFSNCTNEKVDFIKFEYLVIYPLDAHLPCLLSPLSSTKPRLKSKTDWKFNREVAENALVILDSSEENILLVYDSLFDQVEYENVQSIAEGLIKLNEDGRIIIFTAPTSDAGVTHMKQISSEYIIVYVSSNTWRNAYLVSTDLNEINYLTNGSVEVVNLDKLIFKSSGKKAYWKEGGAFWYNAIIDRNGKIVDIDNESLDPNYKICFSKSDFLKKSYIELPESARDIICVSR